MSYLTKVLQPGETVLATTKLHWFVYLPAVLALALAVGCALASYHMPRELQWAMLVAAAILALTGLVSWLSAAIRRASTELAVTDHRVIYKVGVFSRHTAEMNRSKVESVDVEQTLTGRLFGYGTLVLRGTGGTFEPIRNIADPLAFRSAITAG
jgi:uncharacterized membrane protein YdbT with pleckstrin-like domain